MEGSEPSLVPQWLRSTGSISGGGGSGQHCASTVHLPRNGCSKIRGDKNSHRPFLDRTSSGNSRHSLSKNGSSKHPYSSFNRNSHDRNREKEKDTSLTRDWDFDNVDPLGDILISRTEKDSLRRSHSLLCRKPSESLPGKSVDVKGFGNNNHSSNNGVLSGGFLSGGAQRTAFNKDFPSLGVEERYGGADVRRVPSPGMTMGMQSLIRGEGWTSALAEVPTIIGSNLRPISVQHNGMTNVSSAVSSPLVGPNMADALSQDPPRARTPSQLPDKTQILEELAIKQSKQLIPMTPSMPKGLVHNSDKLKIKTSLRSSEPVVTTKSLQQPQPHSSHITNQSVRGGQVKSEATGAPRSSKGGKFLVLKPLRDSSVPVGKDVTGATNNANKAVTNTLAGVSVAASDVKSPKSSMASNVEGKVSALSLNTGPFGEKRPSLSQAQSRSDFFKLMKEKSSMSASGSSTLVERTAEMAEGADSSVSSCITENGSKVIDNGDSHEEKNLCVNGMVYPDEEEAAFLRSLGWDENAGEDEGLTEEEINAFYEEYMKMKPSLKLCRDVEQKITSLCESHTTESGKASSELSFSETEIEA